MVRCIGHSWHLYSWRCWWIHFCPEFLLPTDFSIPGGGIWISLVWNRFHLRSLREHGGEKRAKSKRREKRWRCGLQVVMSCFFRDYLLVFLCLLTGVFFFHDVVKSNRWVLLLFASWQMLWNSDKFQIRRFFVGRKAITFLREGEEPPNCTTQGTHPTERFFVRKKWHISKTRTPSVENPSLLSMAWMGFAAKLIVEVPTFDFWAQNSNSSWLPVDFLGVVTWWAIGIFHWGKRSESRAPKPKQCTNWIPDPQKPACLVSGRLHRGLKLETNVWVYKPADPKFLLRFLGKLLVLRRENIPQQSSLDFVSVWRWAISNLCVPFWRSVRRRNERFGWNIWMAGIGLGWWLFLEDWIYNDYCREKVVDSRNSYQKGCCKLRFSRKLLH